MDRREEIHMAIKIKRYDDEHVLTETLESIGKSDGFTMNPDDRIELIQTINGVTIADGGRVPYGDRYSFSAVFDSATYNKIKNVWNTREVIDIVFDDNTTMTNMIIVVKAVTYYDNVLPSYKKLQIETWKAGM